MAVDTEARATTTRTSGGWASWLNQRETREAIYQALILIAIASLVYMIVSNTIVNLRKQNIASGFGFWDTTAGFDVSQSLIEYSATSSYGKAFWVGLLNTLLVSVIGIFFATILGFFAGIARLSNNWLVAKIAAAYVEIVRNIPLLLQLFIWYFAVLKSLPPPRQSHELPGGSFLNVRGLYMPSPIYQPGLEFVIGALLVAIAIAVVVGAWARRRRILTGERFPVLWTTLGLIIGAPAIAAALTGFPFAFEYPALRGFNFTGGIVVQPEFMALLLGLVFYTGGYIAEVVRAGIQGISKGQKEAARALGLTSGQMLRLVVIPQAMRIIIPPLTSNYLNLTKNSSLAVAIGYPDLVSVFTGTVLNQTGQAVEVILITMAVYLTLSLLTSAFMNWFNKRMALVER